MYIKCDKYLYNLGADFTHFYMLFGAIFSLSKLYFRANNIHFILHFCALQLFPEFQSVKMTLWLTHNKNTFRQPL